MAEKEATRTEIVVDVVPGVKKACINNLLPPLPNSQKKTGAAMSKQKMSDPSVLFFTYLETERFS